MNIEEEKLDTRVNKPWHPSEATWHEEKFKCLNARWGDRSRLSLWNFHKHSSSCLRNIIAIHRCWRKWCFSISYYCPEPLGTGTVPMCGTAPALVSLRDKILNLWIGKKSPWTCRVKPPVLLHSAMRLGLQEEQSRHLGSDPQPGHPVPACAGRALPKASLRFTPGCSDLDSWLVGNSSHFSSCKIGTVLS